jgi:predicted RNA binding protein YcfA (HicA-like mRNA interferase family)
LIAALKRAGATERPGKGSHVPMSRIAEGKVFRTVVPLHKELATGTLMDILRQIGLTRDELIKLL